jgi:5'-nucleotidase/UDP-sugar diphosphatase
VLFRSTHHTVCFESFGNGSSLGHAILQIDRATRGLVGWKAPHDQGVLVSLFEDEIHPDAATQAVIKPWSDKTDAEMGRVVGRLTGNAPRGGPGGNLVGNLVTDAMRERFKADFAFQNLGGLRADLAAGDVTARHVFSVLPFGNELVVAKIPGELLIRLIERKVQGGSGGICISGGQVIYNPSRPDGQRLCVFTIGGQPVEPQKIYRVVLTNYLMEGNSGLDMLTSVPQADVETTRVTPGEAFETWLTAHNPAQPRLDDRWLEEKGCERAAYLNAGGGS